MKRIILILIIAVFLILRSRMKKNFRVISPKKFSSKNPHHSESITRNTHNISTIDRKTLRETEFNQKNIELFEKFL